MKRKILSILLCICVMVSLMPTVALAESNGGSESANADSLTFGYAYDAQRSPDYPAQGETVNMTYLNEPLKQDAYPGGDRYESYAGTWTLIKVGAYSNIQTPSSNLTSVVSYLATEYSIADSGTIIVHELKNGNEHVAYGVLVAYDQENGKALFLGDNWNAGGAGYLLSETEITNITSETTVTITAGAILTDFIRATYGITLDQTGAYKFTDAKVGYGEQSALTVTVSNGGNEATGALSVTLSGDGADKFTLSPETGALSSIEANGTATFTVAPKTGLAAGTYTATVSVSGDNVTAKTFVVSFTVKSAASSHSASLDKKTLTVEIAEGTNVKTESLLTEGSSLTSSLQGNVSVSKDESSVTITPNEGYEIESVTLNGVDKGSVDTLEGLKSTDKLVVKFKEKAASDKDDGQSADNEKAQLAKAKETVGKLSLLARSSKISKKNIKVVLKMSEEASVAIGELKDLGYTVKYKYYRSTKKSSQYVAKKTKATETFTNTNGVKGTRYYYKARVQVYDKNGTLVAQTALKQCKYACRQWTK